MHVYLRTSQLESHPEFPTHEKHTLTTNPNRHFYLRGLAIHYDNDAEYWYCNLDDSLKHLPAAIRDMVEKVSIIEHIPAVPKRARGVYALGTAEAEVEVGKYAERKHMLQIHATGSNPKATRELLQAIKLGTIQPDEGKNYDAPQGGPSREELEVEIARLEEEIRKLEVYHAKFAENSQRHQELREYALVLERSKWPFCRKGPVAQMILHTIDDFRPPSPCPTVPGDNADTEDAS